MNLKNRITVFVAVLVLLLAPVSALAKTGKPAKAVKPSVATVTVKPQGSCDQSCFQEFFDAIETCNSINYLDPSEGLYTECIQMAQRNLGLCQFFCRAGGILGIHWKRPKSATDIRGFVRLSE